MITLGPDTASCEVFTFKEGLLSPVAHDLLLRVTAFELAIDPATPAISARLDARSLRVVSAMRDGRPAPDALSAADRADIERTLQGAVLDAGRHPEIRFVSSAAAADGGGYRVEGTLTLAGASRPLTVRAVREEGRLVASVRLHQPDFGIKPYRAMLGALRVQPDVVVRVSIPADGL